MVLTYTIVFYIYQRVFKAHKLNDKKKLTGGPSPTVQRPNFGFHLLLMSFHLEFSLF